MRKVQRYYEVALVPLGITPVQFYVLSALWEENNIKFKTLTQRLNMDGPTLTGILDRLERLDYLERKDDPEDRRSLLICLSDKAETHATEFRRLAHTLDNEFKTKFGSEDFKTLCNLLDRIRQDE
jgi:DNA-binding MarR family transcriptional regulator